MVITFKVDLVTYTKKITAKSTVRRNVIDLIVS